MMGTFLSVQVSKIFFSLNTLGHEFLLPLQSHVSREQRENALSLVQVRLQGDMLLCFKALHGTKQVYSCTFRSLLAYAASLLKSWKLCVRLHQRMEQKSRTSMRGEHWGGVAVLPSGARHSAWHGGLWVCEAARRAFRGAVLCCEDKLMSWCFPGWIEHHLCPMHSVLFLGRPPWSIKSVMLGGHVGTLLRKHIQGFFLETHTRWLLHFFFYESLFRHVFVNKHKHICDERQHP